MHARGELGEEEGLTVEGKGNKHLRSRCLWSDAARARRRRTRTELCIITWRCMVSEEEASVVGEWVCTMIAI